jgi:DNA-binding transcriptional LysR family regulator
MELRHMRYFVAVAEEKNFTRAAARLRLAQPSLSRQIRDLEEELGVALLHRAKGGIALTAAGAEYLAQARKLLADSAAAIQATKAAGRSQERQLVIGTVEPLVSSGFLTRVLKRFAAAQPNVRIQLRELVSIEQHCLIAGRELDGGFVYRPPDDASLFSTIVVLENHHVAALPAGHRLATKEKLFLGDLAQESFVQFPRQLWPERVDAVARKCLEAGFTLRVVQEAQRIHTLVKLVAEGFGVAIIPRPFCSEHQRVICKKLVDFELPANLQFIWLRQNNSPLLEQFAESGRAVAAENAGQFDSPEVPAI